MSAKSDFVNGHSDWMTHLNKISKSKRWYFEPKTGASSSAHNEHHDHKINQNPVKGVFLVLRSSVLCFVSLPFYDYHCPLFSHFNCKHIHSLQNNLLNTTRSNSIISHRAPNSNWKWDRWLPWTTAWTMGRTFVWMPIWNPTMTSTRPVESWDWQFDSWSVLNTMKSHHERIFRETKSRPCGIRNRNTTTWKPSMLRPCDSWWVLVDKTWMKAFTALEDWYVYLIANYRGSLSFTQR